MGSVSIAAVRLIVYAVLLVFLASTAVTLRFISVRIRRRSLASHDYLCLFSLLNLFGYVIDLIYGATKGAIGQHQVQVLEKDDGYAKTVTSLKALLASQIFWSSAIVSYRLAILSLYIEIFRKRRFYIVAISTAVIVIAYYVACLLTIFLLCRPLNFNWDKTLEGGKCGNGIAVEIFSAAYNMFVDVWVVCLPLPVVWTLQIPFQKKIALSTIFALGLTNAAINLGRLIQNIQCDPADATYCIMGSAMLVIGEISTGIMVACVPALGPLLFPHRSTQQARNTFQNPSDKVLPQAHGPKNTNFQNPRLGALHSDQQCFDSSDDGDLRMTGTLQNQTYGYEAHVDGQASVRNDSAHSGYKDGIQVRKDLYLDNTLYQK